MIVDALKKIFQFLIYKVVEKILVIIYLSLPLWFHMFVLQMREKVDTLPSINGYLDEKSTWAMIYDGVALVNTKPGELREKFQSFKAWVIRKKATWVVLATIFYFVIFILFALYVIRRTH